MLAGQGLNNPTQWRANLQSAEKIPATSLKISESSLEEGSSSGSHTSLRACREPETNVSMDLPQLCRLQGKHESPPLQHSYGICLHPYDTLIPILMTTTVRIFFLEAAVAAQRAYDGMMWKYTHIYIYILQEARLIYAGASLLYPLFCARNQAHFI